jgi:hypothetical protein
MRIVEVKSGSSGVRTANAANKSLLNLAKNDLKQRLNDAESHVWMNAIYGARHAVANGKIKKEIQKILTDCHLEAEEGEPDSTSKNVILASVLYESLDNPVSIDSVEEKANSVINEGCFAETTIFSIQKETWERIVEFLEAEAAA